VPAPSLFLLWPGCTAVPDGPDAFSSVDLHATWGPQDPDGVRDAVLTRQGLAAGTLRVEPPKPPLAGRLWRTVLRATGGLGLGHGPGPDRTARHALLSLDAAPAPTLDDAPAPAGAWNILLTPVWRTAAGTTVAVAQLPVPCPTCDQPHSGGICVLLPLSGSQEP
jgi:hypothetical protein